MLKTDLPAASRVLVGGSDKAVRIMASIKLMLVSIVSIAVFLGLAIVGRGGPAEFFSHAPLIALTVITLVLTVAASFTAGNLDPGQREDRSNRWRLSRSRSSGC